MTPPTVAEQVQAQVAAWDHLGPGDIACLVTAARAVDASAEAVDSESAAPLPLINGCRYLADMLRKAAPPAPAAGPGAGTADRMAEWLED